LRKDFNDKKVHSSAGIMRIGIEDEGLYILQERKTNTGGLYVKTYSY